MIIMTKEDKKRHAETLRTVVGRIGIVNTLRLLTKYMRPNRRVLVIDEGDYKLNKILHDHADVLKKAKKKCRKLIERFDHERG